MNFASCTLGGRLTHDPETKSILSGKTVTEFSVAVNNPYKQDAPASFFNCSAWGKTGENIAQYFHKGDLILVSGRAEIQQWEKDGQKRSKFSLDVREFSFVESKKSKTDGGDGQQDLGGGGIDESSVPF